jgi:ankyrin repeat protein
MAELLLRCGADVNLLFVTYSDTAETPLKVAVKTGRLDLVQSLLRAGARVNDFEPRYGDSALQIAAATSKPEFVRLPINAGADFDAPPYGRWGKTAVQAAAVGWR